jgi:hypothetical protein
LLKYGIDGKRIEIEIHFQTMKKQITITTKNVCNVSMSIALKQAYEEYHYGVFNNHQIIS